MLIFYLLVEVELDEFKMVVEELEVEVEPEVLSPAVAIKSLQGEVMI